MWLEGYEALRVWRAEHGGSGLCAVPYDAEVAVGASRRYPVERRVHEQRRARREGALSAHRVELLDGEGMVWEPQEEAWERTLAGLHSYRAAYGHLAPRWREIWGEGEDVMRVGDLMANLRRPGGLGKNRSGPPRAAQLRAVDEDWIARGRCPGSAATGSSSSWPPTNPAGGCRRSRAGSVSTGTSSGRGSRGSRAAGVGSPVRRAAGAAHGARGLRPIEKAPERAGEGAGRAGKGAGTAGSGPGKPPQRPSNAASQPSRSGPSGKARSDPSPANTSRP
ncbi:helicase associated domain-containing protein [Streptomyces sp. NPDC060243]|uniref:helicase associated domain-containing protein n=1 Tax=Streptomyces sp. NPDC060243 TaxID=3347081 RepID=UPI00364C43F0